MTWKTKNKKKKKKKCGNKKKSDLNKNLLRINTNNIHDKVIYSTKKRSTCTLPEAFVLNTLVVVVHVTNQYKANIVE